MIFNRPESSLKLIAKKIISWPTSPAVTRAVFEPILRRAGRRAGSEEIRLSELKRVLVIRLDEIGDLVLMSPFLRELRRNLPEAWITLVVKPGVFNLVEKCPYVQEVLTFDWTADKYTAAYIRQWRALKLARERLWPRRFDLAILPRWDVDSYQGTILAYLSGARWRLGFSEKVAPWKEKANRGFDRLLTHVLDERALKHELLRNLDVLRYLGCELKDEGLEVWLTEEDKTEAARLLNAHGGSGQRPLMGLGPGAFIGAKRWPLARFIEVAAWMQNKYGARVLVVGGPEDVASGSKLQAELGGGVLNLAGQTTLRQTAALLGHCRLYLGNDSGPLHLAAAAKVPVIGISRFPRSGNPLHDQSPLRFGPWGAPSRILQPEQALPPCTEGCGAQEAHCILGVTVDQVKDAVRDLLRPNYS